MFYASILCVIHNTYLQEIPHRQCLTVVIAAVSGVHPIAVSNKAHSKQSSVHARQMGLLQGLRQARSDFHMEWVEMCLLLVFLSLKLLGHGG